MTPPEPLPPVAFIGLGNMGTPMARRLIAAGYTVTGFDIAEEPRAQLVAEGAKVTESAAAAVAGARVVILMLPDSTVVESVLAEETVLTALEPGTIIVDMSSSEPLRTRALAERLGAHGFTVVDAPVSGGVAGANAGTLTIMVGADASVAAALEPLLGTLGRTVHAGSVGAGHAAKALNNLLSASHLWVTSEAMLAGERFGIEPEVLLSIFNGSSGRSGSTEHKWPNFILTEAFDSGFGLRLMLKDMRIAVGLAEKVGSPSELGSEAVELWARASAELAPSADHTEVARWLRLRDEGSSTMAG